MPIQQRQLFTATIFEFRPEQLHYTFKTPRLARRLAIDYADISVASRRIAQRHDAYFHVGLVLVALGAIFGAYVYATEQRLAGFSYALWGLLFVIAYFVQRSTFIVFSVGGEPLIVLDDKMAPEIIARIDRHRKQRCIELLCAPELVGDAAKRQEFVSWLLEQRVLAAEEIAALTSGGGA